MQWLVNRTFQQFMQQFLLAATWRLLDVSRRVFCRPLGSGLTSILDIMSGLYIAVILENFELEDEEIKRYQIRQFIQRKALKSKNKVQSFLDR